MKIFLGQIGGLVQSAESGFTKKLYSKITPFSVDNSEMNAGPTEEAWI